jgi:hypothetical protein
VICESLLGLVRPDRIFGGLLPPECDLGGLVLPDLICNSGLAGNRGRSDRRSPVGLISRLKRGEYRAGIVVARDKPFRLSRFGATLW